MNPIGIPWAPPHNRRFKNSRISVSYTHLDVLRMTDRHERNSRHQLQTIRLQNSSLPYLSLIHISDILKQTTGSTTLLSRQATTSHALVHEQPMLPPIPPLYSGTNRPVSYTHLDVYKRQESSMVTNISLPPIRSINPWGSWNTDEE